MKSEAVICQSIKIDNKPVQQLSNLLLDGLSTMTGAANTDRGSLYGSFTYDGTTYSVTLYKDSGRTLPVASTSTSTLGLATLSEANDSGISGAVNIIQWVANDPNIEVVCFLSDDDDIQMSYLESLPDYDQDVGFAAYHIAAFDDIKRIVRSRYTSELWNADLIDTRQVNGGRGGYDLSRILNWESLREASAHYALWHIVEKQDIQDGAFRKRAEESRNFYNAYLSKVELQFDLDTDRVPNKVRNFSTWRIGRA